jgi:hypothetical protein
MIDELNTRMRHPHRRQRYAWMSLYVKKLTLVNLYFQILKSLISQNSARSYPGRLPTGQEIVIF